MRPMLFLTMLLLTLIAAPPLAAQVAGNDRVGLSQPSVGIERGRPQFAMPRNGNESY